MSFLRISLLCAVVVVVAPCRADEPVKPVKPTKEAIARWVQQLGDNDFNVREEATKKLWEAGSVAEPALREAVKNEDAEISRRAGELLDKFKWGIYPDTPKNVVDMINRYQGGDMAAKLGIIKELVGAGSAGCKAVLKIASVEENADIKKRVLAEMSQELPRTLPVLLADNDHATLETLLAIGLEAEDKSGIRNAASYWLLSGKLDEKIAHYKALEAKSGKPKQQAEILAYLHRARGDLAAAHEAAKRADQAELVEALLFEAGAWKDLAQAAIVLEVGREVERLGYRAAYHRLAGNSRDFEEAIKEILKLADTPMPNDDEQLFYIAKALFLNYRPKEALQILTRSKNHQTTLFEILAAQLRYKEALAVVDKARNDGNKDLPALEVMQARTLYGLGEKEKATAIFNRLAAEIKPGGDILSWFVELVDAELRSGLADQAFDHAAQVLAISRDQGDPERFFAKLFPGKTEPARALWSSLKVLFPLDDIKANLKRLRELLQGKAEVKDVKQWIENVEKPARDLKPVEADQWWRGWAEAALAAGQDDLAQACLEKAGSAAGLLRLGDLLAAKKQWERAAERYQQASDKARQEAADPARRLASGKETPVALPLYLSGKALVEAGQEKEGKKRMELAHWLPLGNEVARFEFGTGLLQHSQTEASRREGDLLMKLSQPGSYYAGEAMRRVALVAYEKKDLLRSADYQERATLRCLRTYISFLAKPAYVGVPCLINRQRASGLLAAGKFKEALEAVALCQDSLPGNVEVPIQLVPELERLGHKKEAGELFQKTLAPYEALCKEYPRCAWSHNSIAWLSACCRRNLDEALTHAQKAVELAPNNAGHIDTLAEVHFQRGDKDKAVEFEKKVIALEPKRPYFRKQLKRLEAGDPRAPLPPENDLEEDEE